MQKKKDAILNEFQAQIRALKPPLNGCLSIVFGNGKEDNFSAALNTVSPQVILFYLHPSAASGNTVSLRPPQGAACFVSEISPESYYPSKAALLVHELKIKEVKISVAPELGTSFEHEVSRLADAVNIALSSLETISRSRLNRLRSCILNLPNILEFHKNPLPRFEPGFSCILCGAGPSLKNDLELIKEHSSEAVIIACGHAAATLCDAGINPDIIADIDNIAHHHWDKTRIFDSLFLGVPMVSPELPGSFRRMIWGCSDSPYFNTLLREWGVELHSLCISVSVMVTALDFAVKSGCRNIALTGSDLCVTNEGSTHSDEGYGEACPGELLFEIPGTSGTPVLTNADFNKIRIALEDYLEQILSEKTDLKIFNCSGGAAIQGTENLNLKEYFEADSASSEKRIPTEEKKDDPEKYSACLNKLSLELDSYIARTGEMLECASKLRRELSNSTVKMLKVRELERDLNALCAGETAIRNGGQVKYIVIPVMEQSNELINEMPFIELKNSSDPMKRAVTFQQRFSFINAFCRDIAKDLKEVAKSLENPADETGRDPFIFETFRDFALSFIKKGNSELADFMEKGFHSGNIDADIYVKDQGIPIIKTITAGGIEHKISSLMEFGLRTAAENEAFEKENSFDPSKHGIVFSGTEKWINLIEFAKKYPTGAFIIIDPWPEVLLKIVSSGIFMHLFPSDTLVISPQKELKKQKRLYDQTLKRWKKSGRKTLFFGTPEF